MTSINRLTNKPSLEDNDLIPIWDAEAGRTRNITSETLRKYVNPEGVVSGTYSDGVLKLVRLDGTEIEVSGFATNSTDLQDMPQSLEAGKILKVNPNGDGYILVSEPSIGGEINVFNENIFVSSVDGIDADGIQFEAPVNGVSQLRGVGQPEQIGELHALYTYDPETKKMTDTGVKAFDGTITTSAGSTIIGAHKISSVGQNVAFRNESYGNNYVPPWSQITTDGDADPMRISFTSQIKDVVRNADTSVDITNPEWYIQDAGVDEVVFGVEITYVNQPINEVVLYGYENTNEVFKAKLGDLSVGVNRIMFEDPVFIKDLSAIQISISSELGDVIVKGNAQDIPAYKAIVRDYEELKLITNDDASFPIEQLSNVNLLNPQDGQTLVYDGEEFSNADINVDFYQVGDGGSAVVSTRKAAFPNASVFIGNDGRAVIDTGSGVQDNKGGEAQDVITFTFNNCTVTEQAIPGRTARNAVITPDADPTPAQYLAYLRPSTRMPTSTGTTAATVSKHVIWPDVVQIDSGKGFEFDATNKEFSSTLPEGAHVMLALSAGVHEIAINGGIVEMFCTRKDDLGDEYPLEDIDGSPVAIAFQYKAGSSLPDLREPLASAFIVDAASLTNVRVFLLQNVVDEASVSSQDEFPTGIMLQQIEGDSCTGEARQQFELDTGVRFNVEPVDYTKPIYDVSFYQSTVPESSAEYIGFHRFNDNFILQALQPVEIFRNPPIDVWFQNKEGSQSDYVAGQVINSEYTVPLRGKSVTATMYIAAGLGTGKIYVISWNGIPDEYGDTIYTGRFAGGLPQWNTGWTLVASEDVNTIYDGGLQFVVPADSNNIAVLVSPTDISPSQASVIRTMQISADVPFVTHYLKNLENSASEHLRFYDLYANLEQATPAKFDMYYPISDSLAPMPCGIQNNGGLNITIDPTVNKATNPLAKGGEGAIEFQNSGFIEVRTWVRFECDLPAGQSGTVTFQWNNIDENDALTPIAASVTTIQATGGAPIQWIELKTFSEFVSPGGRIGINAIGSVAGIGRITSSSALNPMIRTKIDLKEQVSVDLLPQLGDSMRASYVTQDANPLKQTLQANDAPETLILNTLDLPSSHLTVDLGAGVFTFIEDEDVMATISAQVIREVGGSGLVNWVMFVETSIDNGATWVPLPGSARRVSFTSQEANEHRFVDFTAPVTATAGTKFRFRHTTNDATKQVSVVSEPALNGAPTSAGLIVGFYSVI